MFKNDWFSELEDGGTLDSQRPRLTKNDIDLLYENITDLQTMKDEEARLRQRLAELKSDSENYARQSARAFSDISSTHDNFTDSIKGAKRSLKAKEDEMIGSLEDAENAQKKMTLTADRAVASIEDIKKDNDNQRQIYEEFKEDAKNSFKKLRQESTDMKSQLAGYRGNLNDSARQASQTMQKFQSDLNGVSQKLDNIEAVINDWEDDFDESASRFQDEMHRMDSILKVSLGKITDNSLAIQNIKEQAERDQLRFKDAVAKTQQDMNALNALCDKNEQIIDTEYKKAMESMDRINTSHQATADLLDANQREVDKVLTELARIVEERKVIARKCEENFSEAESVAKDFSNYMSNLLAVSSARISNYAGAYDHMYTTMTGSAPEHPLDKLDKHRGGEYVLKQVRETNEMFDKGIDGFTGKPLQEEKQNQQSKASLKVKQQKVEPEPVEEQEPMQKTEPEPVPRQRSAEQRNKQESFATKVNIDDIATAYMEQMTEPWQDNNNNYNMNNQQSDSYYNGNSQQNNQYEQQNNPYYESNNQYGQQNDPYNQQVDPYYNGYTDEFDQQDFAGTTNFDYQMQDDAYNQNGNMLETGMMIGDEGTMMLNGTDMSNFDMPFSPMPEEPEPKGKKSGRFTSGLFKKK